MQDPVAILLCAGYGTRMGALTASTPKPLLPLAGRPVLDHLVEQLRELPGLAAIRVVTNRRGHEAFSSWARSWRRRLPAGLGIEVWDDGSRRPEERLGAVGDLAFCLERAGVPDGALVAAGDNVYRFSLGPFWRAFLDGEGSRVLALHEPDPAKLRRTGVLELGPGERVLRLWEKPDEPPSSWACPSLYALQRRALERVGPYLAAGGARDEIGRFVADLVGRQPVFAHRVHGERLHVGSPESYRHARRRLEEM